MPEIQIALKSLHQAQKQILSEAKRFNVLKCGRRFGKTELTKELTINPMLDGLLVGYWCPTYKDLSEVWRELKFTLYPIIKSTNEQLKQIILITGGVLDMWSLEDPNSGRGRKYHRIIIDEAEKARNFEEAWLRTIAPTLTDYEGDAWFMSTPKFGQTYFKKIFNFKEHDPDWMSWRFTTYDNPFLKKEEIDKAKKRDELTFRCEYLAEDVDLTNNPFAYSFVEDRHVGECEYNPEHELYLSFDFNVDPITCIAVQYYNSHIYFVKEFRLRNSDIYALCDRIKAEFPHSIFFVTGDATGRNRSALAQGNINYYTIIQQKFNLGYGQMKQPTINPSVADSRVLLNSLLQNHNILFDKQNCPYAIEDLKYTEVDDNGDIKKKENELLGRGHLLDAIRYYFSTFHADFLKML